MSNVLLLEFVEGVCNFELAPYQKKFAQETYKALKERGVSMFIPAIGMSKMSLRLIEAAVVLYFEVERGAANSNLLNNTD